MRVSTAEQLGPWAFGLGLIALVVLAWSVFAPGGVFWTAALAAALVGGVTTTAVLVRSRSVPSLAQVIATAEAEPAGSTTPATREGHASRSRW